MVMIPCIERKSAFHSDEGHMNVAHMAEYHQSVSVADMSCCWTQRDKAFTFTTSLQSGVWYTYDKMICINMWTTQINVEKK